MASRIAFLDYMRVIACFMVILVHSCEFFFIDGDDIGIRNMEDGFWVCVIDSAFRCSVPLFVMISSYLLVPVNTGVKTFIKRRMVRVVIPFIIWSILYAVSPYIFGGMQSHDIMHSLLHLAYNFNDASGHMWFVYMIIGLYLFMPVISPWLDKVDKNSELCFLLLWFISAFFPYIRIAVGYVYGESYWNEYNMLWYFSGFLGYLVLAHYIRNNLQWNKTKMITIGAILYLLGYVITATVWYNRIPTSCTLQELELSWRFCTPNVIMMSFGAFVVIKAIFPRHDGKNKVVQEISNLSYGIYLMHIFILGAVYSIIEGLFPTHTTILLVGLITFVACCVISKILSYFPFSKYLIG